MSVNLRSVRIPDFSVGVTRPEIPPSTYESRCQSAFQRAARDWLVIYGDREHFANIMFLSGFDPRFEEALLVLGPRGRRILITGNECFSYAAEAKLPDLEISLCQSLSLMGQDRTSKPKLSDVLRTIGVRRGDSIALVGWKYLEPEEWDGESEAGFYVPAYMVDVLKRILGSSGVITDGTPILMHPMTGLRATIDADQIAAFEWAAARSSTALWHVITGIRIGDSEIEAMGRMGYGGEPLSAHPMLASGGSSDRIQGLRSPTARRLRRGDGVVAAIGMWGGLSARGGQLEEQDDAFLRIASGYFEGLVAWYETAEIGVAGGEVYNSVAEALARSGLRSALNPGHLTGHDEWLHTPVRPGSVERLASGMPFQVDIIPTPLSNGCMLNCEDPVTFADGALSAKLRQRHPAVADRIDARRDFVRTALGIGLKQTMLPLSATPLCLPPFWLSPHKLFARA
jgi:hypothetical protein